MSNNAAPLTLHDVEMNHIAAVMEKHGGRKPAAAKELGISLKALHGKLDQRQGPADVADQVFNGETLSIYEVAKACRVHVETIRRWSTIGYKADDGRMMVLKKTKIGRRVLYARSDLAAFLAQVNGGKESANV